MKDKLLNPHTQYEIMDDLIISFNIEILNGFALVDVNFCNSETNKVIFTHYLFCGGSIERFVGDVHEELMKFSETAFELIGTSTIEDYRLLCPLTSDLMECLWEYKEMVFRGEIIIGEHWDVDHNEYNEEV